MFKIVAIVVLIGVAFADPIGTLSSRAAPANNDTAEINIDKIPYHVAIRSGRSHRCSGAIISEDWILSSAKCVGINLRWFTVRVGASYAEIGGRIHNISQIIKHENYTSSYGQEETNVIVLIRLERPLTFDAACQPIKLYKTGEDTPDGTHAVLSGYMAYVQNPGLLIQNLTVLRDCKQRYPYDAPKDPSQVCAVYNEHDNRELCIDEEGGPVTVNGRLAGIVIRGTGCPGRRGVPIVYADIAYFREWIQKHSGI